MRSVRRLLVVAAAMLAFTLAVPSVSASTHKAFHLDKTCAGDASEPLGYVCTVQHSDFKWIPAGTKVHYTSQNAAGDVVQATIDQERQHEWCLRLEQPRGRDLHLSPGSGRFAQFHLRVAVSVVGDPNAADAVWHWDGWYWFGGRD